MSSYVPDLELSQFGLTGADTEKLTRDKWEFWTSRLRRLKSANEADRQRVLDEVNKVRNQQRELLTTLHPMHKSAIESYIKVLSRVFFSPVWIDRAIVCTQADVYRYFGGEGRGRGKVIEKLKDDGYFDWYERRGSKFLVVLKNPSDDEPFRQFIKDCKSEDRRGKGPKNVEERGRTWKNVE